MSSDAIVMLKEDHNKLRRLFRDFKESGEGAAARRGNIVGRIIEQLTVHSYLENEVMYPEVRRQVPGLDSDVMRAYEEHHVADVLALELSTMDPHDDHYSAKAQVLIDTVSHHMDEEENGWFPQVRDALGRKALQDLGARMAELRERAPHKPVQPSALKKALDALVS